MIDNHEVCGKLFIIGCGPGDVAQMTASARAALAESEVVIGYRTYLKQLEPLLGGKEVLGSGMKKEIERAQLAVQLARTGKRVAIVSSGDAGIYGMAGPVREVMAASEAEADCRPDVQVVPGVSALSAAAALLGAPLMHDFAAVSLSDLLTPWETIVERVRHAAQADFVLALYNPISKERSWQLGEVRRILLEHRAPSTPVGIVVRAYRAGQSVTISDLEHLLEHPMDMQTTIIIGNSTTMVKDGAMITPRGYERKYEFA